MKNKVYLIGLFLFLSIFLPAQAQKITTLNGVKGDALGTAVAMSQDGNYVAVGASGRDLKYTNDGVVKVYKKEGNSYVLVGDSITGVRVDLLGSSVALSSKGDVLAIGGPYTTIYDKHEDGSNDITFNAGSVRVFDLNEKVWTLRDPIFFGELRGESLGAEIALSGDGKTILIASPRSDEFKRSGGKVNVYEYLDKKWSKVGETIAGTNSFDLLGLATDISNNGKIIAISSIMDDTKGTDAGKVDVYGLVAGKWKLIGQPIYADAAMDKFGSDVSLSADGKLIAIGARYHEGSYKGYAKLFRIEKEEWVLVSEMLVGDERGDEFGTTLKLSANGKTLIVGSNNDFRTKPSYLKIYKIKGNKIIEDDTKVCDGPVSSLATSKSGDVLVVGTKSSSVNGKTSGQVKIYN